MQGPLHWEAEEGDMYVSQGKGGEGDTESLSAFVWGLPIICLALLCVT